MKVPACLALMSALIAVQAMAADGVPPAGATHRYMIQRTFPAGALDGLDAATKAKVNATNARYGVKWLLSYSNGDRTRTWCLYEGPSEAAIREAARANGIPVDSVAEVPQTLLPR